MHFSFSFPCSMWQESETSMRILFPISEQSYVFFFFLWIGAPLGKPLVLVFGASAPLIL